METVVLTVYFGGVAVCAGGIIWSGVTGNWSKDDWPVFAIIAPWFWPLLAILAPFMWFEERNTCKCWTAGDNLKCPWHGDGKFVLPSRSTKRLARERGVL